MSKLAIIATIDVAPDRRDQVLPLLMAHRRRCLEDEPGTVAFEVLVPHDDASKILLYELYEDAAAFQAHWNGPSTARFREEAGSMMERIHGTRCALSE
jgi:quinol monooxygenase YgiN